MKPLYVSEQVDSLTIADLQSRWNAQRMITIGGGDVFNPATNLIDLSRIAHAVRQLPADIEALAIDIEHGPQRDALLAAITPPDDSAVSTSPRSTLNRKKIIRGCQPFIDAISKARKAWLNQYPLSQGLKIGIYGLPVVAALEPIWQAADFAVVSAYSHYTIAHLEASNPADETDPRFTYNLWLQNLRADIARAKLEVLSTAGKPLAEVWAFFWHRYHEGGDAPYFLVADSQQIDTLQSCAGADAIVWWGADRDYFSRSRQDPADPDLDAWTRWVIEHTHEAFDVEIEPGSDIDDHFHGLHEHELDVIRTVFPVQDVTSPRSVTSAIPVAKPQAIIESKPDGLGNDANILDSKETI